MDPSNRISRAEIAEQLGVQTRTIAKWERTGRFPAPKEYVSDRVILYDRDEVYAVIESRLMHSQRVVGRLAIVHDDWLLHACGEVCRGQADGGFGDGHGVGRGRLGRAGLLSCHECLDGTRFAASPRRALAVERGKVVGRRAAARECDRDAASTRGEV